MKTETKPTEKKAYHEPQLREFGTVKEGTQATEGGSQRDGQVDIYGHFLYSSA